MRSFSVRWPHSLAAKSPVTLLFGVLLLAAAWKSVFITWDVIPFNADEAVVALMARHIINGARPVFFYGQVYMGSLDAYLAAIGFMVWGQQVWVIRAVQCLLYMATIAVVVQIGVIALNSPNTGLLAALLLAIPAVNTTLYTTASLGGYGEALLIGNLVLLLTYWIALRGIPGESRLLPLTWMVWGLLVGLGVWVNGLTLVYSVPGALYLSWYVYKKLRRNLLTVGGLVLIGLLLGASPWWGYALSQGPGLLIQELFGQAVSVETDPWIVRTITHLVSFILLGLTALFGFRPPWNVQWLALPLLPLMLIFWSGVAVFFYRNLKFLQPHRAEYALLVGVIGTTAAGFMFTSFGVDPSGRYFLPMVSPLALGAAAMILSTNHLKRLPVAMTLLVLVFNAWGTLQCALRYPPGITTQFYEPSSIDQRARAELIRFLREEGETRGYTNYWVAYPLAFLSGEELIFTPRLPYHPDLRYTPRDDRYPAYTRMVAQSERVAYITTRNPALDNYLTGQFRTLGVTWQEKIIGDFQVYYRLSKPVHPQQIGLGEARE